MAVPTPDRLLHRLRAAVTAHQPDPASDARLLERFAAGRDEAAFAAPVRRHGPTVLGVCRRVLGDAADADDAFQATFLVLARRAGAIRGRESLRCWLHGVALRVARRARQRRQRPVPPPAPRPALPDPGQEAAWRELCGLLDAELARLPDRLRAPLILCYLHGRTRDEAAAELGWSLSTVKRRVERGREVSAPV